jgi:hypothetical protein
MTTVYTYKGVDGSNWDDDFNWEEGAAPPYDGTATVVIAEKSADSAYFTIACATSIWIDSLTITNSMISITATTTVVFQVGTIDITASTVEMLATMGIFNGLSTNIIADGTSELHLTKNINGNGTFNIQGGYVIHAGDNMVNAITLQSGATLEITGSYTNALTNVKAGATLKIGNGGIGGKLMGSGALTIDEGGEVIVHRATAETSTNVHATTGSVIPTPEDIDNLCIFAKPISGLGTITIKSPSYAVFTNSNNEFYGNVEIESGAYAQLGNVVNNIHYGGSFGATENAQLYVSIVNNGTFVIRTGVDTIAPIITGTGNVEKRNPGNLLFIQDNTYTGKTITYGGGITFGSTNNLTTSGGCMNSSEFVNAGTSVETLSINKHGHQNMYAGTFVGKWRYNYVVGPTWYATPEVIAASSLTITKSLPVASSNALSISGLGDSSDEGTFNIVYGRVIVAGLGEDEFKDFFTRYVTSGTIVVDWSSGNAVYDYSLRSSILEFQCSGDATATVATTGPLQIVKSGPGKLTMLSPANTPVYSVGTISNGASYTPVAGDGKGIKLLHFGPTVIEAGSLVMNNQIVRDSTMAQFRPSTTASRMTAASGTRISGSGKIGQLALVSGAILAPGNSPGLLTVDGDLDFAAGAIYEWEIDGYSAFEPQRGTSYDAINVNGTVTINAAAELHIKLLGIKMYNPFWDQSRAWDIIRTPDKSDFSQSFQTQRLYLDGVERTSSKSLLVSYFSNSPDTDHLALAWTASPVPVVFIGKLHDGVNDPADTFDGTEMIPGVITTDSVIEALLTENIDTELTPIAMATDRDSQVDNANLLGSLVHGENVPMDLVGTDRIIDADGLYSNVGSATYLNILGAYGVDKNMLACYYVPPGESAPITPQEIRQLYVLVPNTTNSTSAMRGTRIRLPVGTDAIQSGSFTSGTENIVYSYPLADTPFTDILPAPGALSEDRGRYGFVLLNKGWQLLQNVGVPTTFNEAPAIDTRNLDWSQIRDICRFSQWRLNSYEGYSGPVSVTPTDNTHFAVQHNTTLVPGKALDVFMIEDLPLTPLEQPSKTYHEIVFEKSDRDFNDVVFALESESL